MDSVGSLFTNVKKTHTHKYMHRFLLLFLFFFFPRIKQKTFKVYMPLLSLKMCSLGLFTCTSSLTAGSSWLKSQVRSNGK